MADKIRLTFASAVFVGSGGLSGPIVILELPLPASIPGPAVIARLSENDCLAQVAGAFGLFDGGQVSADNITDSVTFDVPVSPLP